VETNRFLSPLVSGTDDLIQSDHRNGDRRNGCKLVLIGTQGRPEDEIAIRALWTSCAMFNSERVLLRIVHVLTVPMTGPLDVSLPQAELASARILRRAQAIAGMAGVAAETAILRGRSVAEAIVDDARRTGASAIAVRLRSRETVGAHVLLSLTMRRLLRDAPCPVIIVHLPHATKGMREEGRPGFASRTKDRTGLIQGLVANRMP
jgi:nucleotide-binding universal stress UspA family protein